MTLISQPLLATISSVAPLPTKTENISILLNRFFVGINTNKIDGRR